MSYVGLSRVSDQMRTSTLLSTLQKTSLDLGRLQEQLATGNRLLAPSIDPAAADASFAIERNIEQQDQLLTNLQSASRIFSVSDTQLGAAADLIQQAVTLAQANIDSGVTQEERDSIAKQIGELSRSLLDIANTKVGDVFIFGGTSNTNLPFVSEAAGIRYVGQRAGVQGLLGGSGPTQIGATGNEAFGAMSSQVAGYKDLRPAMTTDTRLADLEGASGDGIRLGVIVIRDLAIEKRVDLSGCDSIGDVIDRINAAGGGEITASLAPDGQRLQVNSVNGGLTVTEQGATRAAHDLGICRSTGQGNGFAGDSVDPRVTVTTPLDSLRAGAGIDVAGGLLITNAGMSAAVNLSGALTVGDLINDINAADVGVQARINAAGDGIDIVNVLSGAEMRIGENGGTTAEELGVRSMNGQTLLSDLNGGVGVRRLSGPADFRITAGDGSTFDITLGSARTVQDVVDLINTATGGAVTAGLAPVGNGVVLTDTTGGAGPLSVMATNASDAAVDLGLLGSSDTGTLAGQDRNPICPGGVFAHLAQLADALGRQGIDGNQRVQEVNRIAAQLGDDRGRLVELRSRMGGLVSELENRQQRTEDQQTASSGLLSSLKDTDFTAAISQLQALQTAMQGNLITASRIIGTSLLDFLR